MNFDFIMHIGLIISLIAGIISTAYIAALRLNKYYRGKIRLRVKARQEGFQASALVSQSLSVAEKNELQFNKVYEAQDNTINSAMPLTPMLKTDTASPPDRETHYSMHSSGSVICEEHLMPAFKVGDKVELSDHSCLMTGEIISRHENHDNHRYQYLVNWGKNGVRWAWEDEIAAEQKKTVELDA